MQKWSWNSRWYWHMKTQFWVSSWAENSCFFLTWGIQCFKEHCGTVISKTYIVGGTKTSEVSWKYVSQHKFSHKCNVKMERNFPDNLFLTRNKDIFIPTTRFKKILNDNLMRRHFLFNCRQIIWIIVSNSTSGNEPVPADDLKKSGTEVWWAKDFIFSFRISL